MVVKQAYVRVNNEKHFRNGQVAEVLRVITLQLSQQHEPHVCIHIRFNDGVEDYAAMSSVMSGTYVFVGQLQQSMPAPLFNDTSGFTF